MTALPSDPPILVGTAAGLGVGRGDDVTWSDGPDLTAGTVAGDDVWAIAERRRVVRARTTDGWEDVAAAAEHDLTCILAEPSGVWVGTDEAHLLRLGDGRLDLVEPFERIEDQETWFTPWGGPPAVRSLAVDGGGRLHANVHVGGIPRSSDGGRTWQPTIDIDADVHQVLAHPTEPDVVLAAAAVGLAISEDGGGSWRVEREWLHATYARAVAVAGERVLLSVSNGPRGGRAAVYRADLGGEIRFVRCTGPELPEWFDRNIDSGWLASSGELAAFATSDGDVFMSSDAGERWNLRMEVPPAVRWVAFGPPDFAA